MQNANQNTLNVKRSVEQTNAGIIVSLSINNVSKAGFAKIKETIPAGFRAEMLSSSEPGIWKCKEKIPVIVVQTGLWPRNAKADRVRDAQRQYCEDDPRAQLVTIDDLTRNYHVDAPSLLVEGYRIAKAYQELLGTNVSCPDMDPTENPHQIEAEAEIKPASSSSSDMSSDWEEQSR